jgi:PAS domain S-box-containing protein
MSKNSEMTTHHPFKGFTLSETPAESNDHTIEPQRNTALQTVRSTSRKESEQRLILLNHCVSNLNDIVLVTEAAPISESGPRIVFVNEAFERITGYTPAETLGRSPRFLEGKKTDRRILGEIRQALANRQPIQRQIISYRKDGTEFWLDIDILPLFDPSGKCTHFTAIGRDITETKKTEERFRRLVDSSAQGVIF